jgi:hypothetical protein
LYLHSRDISTVGTERIIEQNETHLPAEQNQEETEPGIPFPHVHKGGAPDTQTKKEKRAHETVRGGWKKALLEERGWREGPTYVGFLLKQRKLIEEEYESITSTTISSGTESLFARCVVSGMRFRETGRREFAGKPIVAWNINWESDTIWPLFSIPVSTDFSTAFGSSMQYLNGLVWNDEVCSHLPYRGLSKAVVPLAAADLPFYSELFPVRQGGLEKTRVFPGDVSLIEEIAQMPSIPRRGLRSGALIAGRRLFGRWGWRCRRGGS